MKLTAILLLFIPFVFQAQSKAYKKEQKRIWSEANFFMDIEDYDLALKLYSQIYLLDEEYDEINYRIGLCYFNIPGEKEKSLSYFQKAKYAGYTESYFWLGRAYHANEEFSQARKMYQMYKLKDDKQIPTKEVERFVDISRYAENAMEEPKFVKVENMGKSINTKHQELLPFITADQSKLIFASQRPGNFGETEEEKFYNDVYVAERTNGKWASAHKFGLEVNSEMNDIVVGMSKTGEILLVNRTKRGMDYGDLYLCEKAGGDWKAPVKLSDNINSEHKESSACISDDGRLIYFSSNRPGGLGGKDIWKVKRLPNDEWATPVNLGGPINTPYDEEAPYFSSDRKTLYFSSNGHKTIGGYDVFSSESRGDGSYKNPVNLGYPINSVDDDMYFTVSEDGKKAYYSSYKEEGYGGSDIYEVSLLYQESYITPVKFLVRDPKTQEPIKAIVTLYFAESGEVYGDYLPNDNGEFILAVKPEVKFEIEISAEGFETSTQDFIVGADEVQTGMVKKEIVLKQ